MMDRVEEISRVTPLGLRFWDILLNHPVGEGLNVVAYPVADSSRRTKAITNRTGVYLLQNLPGLHGLEYGSGDTAFWANPAKKPFMVEVTDAQQRFQDFRFQIDLPYRDLFTNPCGLVSSPLESFDEIGIPLYSAVTRNVPSGFAVLRAQLWDVSNNKAASWTMIEAFLDGQFLGRGFADREGRLALLFAYPEPIYSIISPPNSPPIGNHPPLADQTWLIQLRPFYTPLHPIPEIPDLYATLNQSPATLLSTLSPVSPLAELTLHYGQELVVRSDAESMVWIVP